MRKNKKLYKRLARRHIEELFSFAERIQKVSQELANRAIEIALRIAKHYNIRLEKEKKQRVCKKCGAFLTPGINAKIRLKAKTIIIKCLHCGAEKRWPYVKENIRKRSRSNN
ncbi:ribonuclease P [Candidatus Woesearchaeota archaeon]|nr:ribonuclease P [Candidatus Woesearchaeota archaeon]